MQILTQLDVPVDILRYRELIKRQKREANRRRNFYRIPGWGQRSGFLVDAERDDLVGELVFCEEIVADRIDGKVARLLALNGEIASRSELARARIDLEKCDRFVAAIGGVQEFAARVNSDFPCVVAA